MRHIKTFLYVAALGVYAVALGSVIAAGRVENVSDPAKFPPPAAMSRGAYLAKMGDCISCHKAEGGAPYAGGLAINAPFGTIYSTNITPDKEFGIGNYTEEDFKRVLRKGVAKDGAHLYPAMPYTSYALLLDEDIDALYDFFMHEVKPVHVQPHPTELSFPFNQRWGIWFWNKAFASTSSYKPDTAHDAEWNRGAYLVQSVGHCSACHSPRGPAFEEKGTPRSSSYLSGEILDNWYAADLRGDKASGLGGWSEDDIVTFLKTGRGAGVAAFGNMTQVIENSTQYMTDADAHAVAHYIKSLPAGGESVSYAPDKPPPVGNEHPGAGLYASYCATCHQPDGKGSLPGVPKLAGNPAVLSGNAASLIRIVLEGGHTAKLEQGPAPEKMPAFDKFTDAEIADVVSYIRASWGNHAATVSAREVTLMREAVKK